MRRVRRYCYPIAASMLRRNDETRAARGFRLIGAPGFEPGTSPTRTVRATRLRHAPKSLSSLALLNKNSRARNLAILGRSHQLLLRPPMQWQQRGEGEHQQGDAAHDPEAALGRVLEPGVTQDREEHGPDHRDAHRRAELLDRVQDARRGADLDVVDRRQDDAEQRRYQQADAEAEQDL